MAGLPLQQFQPQAMPMGKCEQLQTRGDPHGALLSLGHSQEASRLAMGGQGKSREVKGAG